MRSFKTILKLFLTFCKIGAFTFGGGYAMIPLIKKEIVDVNKYLNEEDFIDAFSVTQTAPGAIAINMSVFIGYTLQGIPGAIACVFGTVLPSFLIILIIATFLYSYRSFTFVEWIFAGIRPAVLGLLVAAGFGIGRTVLTTFKAIAIFLISSIFLLILNVDPVIVLILATILSYAFGFMLKPDASEKKGIEK